MSAATLSAATPGRVEMTVGYTDPVLGITSWPVTTASWSIQPNQPGAVLAFRVAMQPGGLVPAGTSPGNAAAANASDIAGRFAAVWYQVMQPDMRLSVATSLNQPPNGKPVDMPVAIDGLRMHVAACYAFSAAAAGLSAAFANPAAAATLADVVTHYGVDWQALGLAGGERPLGTLVKIPTSGLSIPAFAIFVAAGTVADLVPVGLDPATVLADPDNTALPLDPGIELVVPSAEKSQPVDGLPLSKLAQRLNITAASLVTANRTRAALLAPGFVFVAQGVEVEVPAEGEPGADATLDDIALAFRNNGVPFDAVMAAVANADRLGMFRPSVSFVVDRQIIAAGWTLAHNPTGIPIGTLAAANVGTVDLFPAGTPLFLKATAVTDLDTAPLGAAARTYAIEPGDLLRHNASLAPVAPAADDSAGLPVPGLAALPTDPARLRIPYRIRAGQGMTAIASLFLSAAPSGSDASPEQALTEANRALRGTIAGGRTITVAGQELPTQAGDSFDAVMARANPPVTIAEFAAAIAPDTQALAANALLLCPPAKLAPNGAISPDQLTSAYGLDATLVLSANAATQGVIVAGVPLKPSPVAAQPTVTTAAADSMNAIVRRFAAAGIAVTIGDIVRANSTVGFLTPGAALLLPPADTALTTIFGASDWQLPDVIFPLRSWATLERNPQLVDPAFRGTTDAPGPAVRASSPIAAARSAAPERQEDGAVTLDIFAAAIETAIPGLKLATGRVLSAERDPAPTDVWAVSFVDKVGITKVKITAPATVPGVDGPQPLSFALRPLSNTLESETGVEIKTLDPKTGGWGPVQTYDYQGIDLEVWARAWLAGMDLICTAPYAAPAYTVAAGPLGRLLAAKKLLACAVADGLSPILVVQEKSGGTIGGNPWKAAREVLYQRLLARLGVAYDTTAILQFNATIDSPAAAATARLSGAGKLDEIGATLAARQLAVGGDPEAWRVSQLGNAKTWLAETTTGTVSFPLDVTQPARHRSVALDPIYAVNEIEFDVTPVVAGYDASNWLSFVRTFDRFPPAAFSADLGTPLVPVPLRAYPELPALVSQTAQTDDDPKTVDDALHWAYVFTYAHQSAAQDQIKLEIEFNRRPPTALFKAKIDTLFGALAQYAAVSDTLWQILAGLAGPDANAGNTVLANTLDTYAGLAERVARLWSGWWGVGSCDTDVAAAGRVRPAHLGPVPPSRRAASRAEPGAAPGSRAPHDAAPHEFYHYLATLDYALVDAVEVYVTLTLKRLDADGDVDWPEIVVIRDDGKEVPLTRSDDVEDETRTYTFPSESADRVPAFTRLAFRCTISGLHIARYQNANSAVAVIRNAHLLGADGPETCTAFVYSTAQLGFPEPLVPLITVSSRLDIGTWTKIAATNPLTALFNKMFDGDPVGREIAVAIRYGYTLVHSDPPIETLLPVHLHPRFTYDPATTVTSIIGAVEDWEGKVLPVTRGGLWGFGISFYSSTDPALDRPLLELKRVVSPLV
jgi:hypothetical protein